MTDEYSEDEALAFGAARTIRVPLLLTDVAPADPDLPPPSTFRALTDAEHAAIARSKAAAQEAYERRIADAWKDDRAANVQITASGNTVRDNGQTEYERQLSNAWRAGA